MRIPCTAREIAAAVGGKLLQDGDTARRVSTDSRDILIGDMFVPLMGERFDGHAYIDMALQKGAAGCLCAQMPEVLLPGNSTSPWMTPRRRWGDLRPGIGASLTSPWCRSPAPRAKPPPRRCWRRC